MSDGIRDAVIDSSPNRGIVKINEDVWGRKLPCTIRLNAYLASNLKSIRTAIKNDWDFPAFFVGSEGSGKTTLAMACALVANKDFCLDDVVFTIDGFIKWTEDPKRKEGDVCLFDEADELSFHGNRKALTVIVRQLKRIRHLNLVIFFATPTFRDLAGYFKGRIRALFYVYANALDDRGYYHMYTMRDSQIMRLAHNLLKWGEFDKTYTDSPKDIPHGIYKELPADYPIDWAAYREKKLFTTSEDPTSLNPKEAVLRCNEGVLKRLLALLERKELHFTLDELADVFGYTNSGIFDMKKRVLGGSS